MDAARAHLPGIHLDLPTERLTRLPRAVAALREGKPLCIVMVGGSIINYTSRSAWHQYLQDRYPKTQITRVVGVRGGTCQQWYVQENRTERFVFQQKPDLVILGGISHRYIDEAVQEAIKQIKNGCSADIFLMTGPYGPGVDPMASPGWRKTVNDGMDEPCVQLLKEIAARNGCEFLDLQLFWGSISERTSDRRLTTTAIRCTPPPWARRCWPRFSISTSPYRCCVETHRSGKRPRYS